MNTIKYTIGKTGVLVLPDLQAKTQESAKQIKIFYNITSIIHNVNNMSENIWILLLKYAH